mgnify:CR=1 FL=1
MPTIKFVFGNCGSGLSGIGSFSAEISVETHRHTEGDWFEYEGYGLSLANSISKSQSANNSSGFVGWTLIYDEPLRIDVIERGTCDFGEWSGSCMRSEAKHHLNITLDWTTNATEFDDDKLMLNITTTILHEEPLATSAWDREKRVVSISSWFLGDDELNLAETETTTTVTTHSSAERPEVMVVGDTWQATLEIHKEDVIRQRINRGMWNETTTSTDESRTNGRKLISTSQRASQAKFRSTQHGSDSKVRYNLFNASCSNSRKTVL